MDRNTALRKIQACLRLAASSNPNEAAAALRQARKLMDEFGLTEADAAAAEIRGCDAPTRSQGAMPTRSVTQLINLVARGFRCEALVTQTYRRTVVTFYGAGADPEVASYAFIVLRRQLDAAKAKHTCRIRKAGNKARRAEEFARGFVLALRAMFPAADLPDGRARAIQIRMGLDAPGAELAAAREIKVGQTKETDKLAGFIAGSQARLHSGLATADQKLLENGQ